MIPGPKKDGEYGWTQIILTEKGKKDEVIRHLTPKCEMLLLHQDWCKLPPNAVNLAYSTESGEYSEAFRIGKNAYGVQFHPELTRDMLEEWLSPPSLRDAKQRLEECFPRYSEIARKMLEAWVRLALAKTWMGRVRAS